MATYLSAKCPVYFAPAMDLDMYKHPTTKQSFESLESFGNIMIPATSGELASGLVGEGRMAEPEDILAFIESDLLGEITASWQESFDHSWANVRSHRSCAFHWQPFQWKDGI